MGGIFNALDSALHQIQVSCSLQLFKICSLYPCSDMAEKGFVGRSLFLWDSTSTWKLASKGKLAIFPRVWEVFCQGYWIAGRWFYEGSPKFINTEVFKTNFIRKKIPRHKRGNNQILQPILLLLDSSDFFLSVKYVFRTVISFWLQTCRRSRVTVVFTSPVDTGFGRCCRS